LRPARAKQYGQKEQSDIMNIKLGMATLGAALIVAGAPALASAQTTQDGPVRLDNVSITQSYGVYNDFEPGRVSVSFTNQSAVAATGVTFDLTDAAGNVLAEYKDSGSYQPGATVRHSFEDIHVEDNQKIEIAAVTFADGTSWSAAATSAVPASIFPAE
jgi:hypothetical protein